MSAASLHTCALLADGTVRCWGLNNQGQIGQPVPADAGPIPRNAKPVAVPGVTGAVEVSAGGYLAEASFTCARGGDGTVRCWGDNQYGELGGGAITDAGVATPVSVEGLSGATQLASGAAHTCAILAGGGVTCWGSNMAGELGRPIPDGGTQFLPPGPFEGLSGASSRVSGGLTTTCILAADGTVSCAGSNDYGILSDPDAGENSAKPVPISGIRGATELAVGAQHACALIGSTGVVACWGDNSNGQLGRTGMGGDLAPQRVELPVDRKAVHIGTGSYTTCAVLDDDSLWCWGFNVTGEVASIDAGAAIPTPHKIEGLPSQRILGVQGGYLHMCALLEGGSMWCWGSDLAGELGRGNEPMDGGTPAFPTPAPVAF
jgi:alpha-tubulin suppressor-like RCC1 family protein